MLVHPMNLVPLAGYPDRHTGVIQSGDLDVVVFDGVPILVPDPADWCACHRDSVVASVAAVGGDVSAVIKTLDAVTARHPLVQAAPFIDDFTREEAHDLPAPALVDDAIQTLVDDSDTPLTFLAGRAAPAEVIVEVGPGAGGLSMLLGAHARRSLYVVDHSLRAALMARRVGGSRAIGVVADAAALPFQDDSIDALYAQNVIDVVDAPDAFIAGIHRTLRRGGTVALTTPDPELGGDGDLEGQLKEAGFEIVEVVDPLRWPRVHGSRHVELWSCLGIIARRL